MSRFLLKSFFVFFLFNLYPSQPDYSHSVMKIIVTKQEYSYDVPWQAPNQWSTNGSGFLIQDKFILTNAHVVADAATVHVQKNKESFPYEATVEYIDHNCDLVALKVIDENFYKDLIPLTISDEVLIGEKIRVVGFPIAGNNLCLTEGITSREERFRYSHSGKLFDVIQIDSAVNGGNSGGPVISQNDGKVVGVVHQGYTQGQNINHIIPIQLVKHFITEFKNPNYFGFPEAGLEIQLLLNPSLQKYFGLEQDQSGVIIKSIDFGSCTQGLLYPGDILIEIAGHKIRNDATIVKDGKVITLFSFLSDKFYQEKIHCVVLRNKKQISVEIPIIKSKEIEQPLVPFSQYDCKPTYFILGGFVFQPLNDNFLNHFKTHKEYIPSSFTFYRDYGKKNKDRTEVIFINRILKDTVNFGYDNLRWSIISEINGQKIRNMEDLVSIVEKTEEPYYVIITESGEKIILDKKEIENNKENILHKYGLISDRSDDLKNKIKE